jgi:hypothetical protein
MKFDTNRFVDSQRQAEYNWEHRLGNEFGLICIGKTLSLDSCQELVDTVWEDFVPVELNRPAPKIVIAGSNANCCWYRRWTHTIHLTPNGQNPFTVLHEAAHALQSVHELWPHGQDKNGNLKTYRQPAHGRGFAALMLNLFYRYYGLNIAEMRRLRKPNVDPFTGKKIGNAVHFAPMNMVPKPLRRVRVAARRLVNGEV